MSRLFVRYITVYNKGRVVFLLEDSQIPMNSFSSLYIPSATSPENVFEPLLLHSNLISLVSLLKNRPCFTSSWMRASCVQFSVAGWIPTTMCWRIAYPLCCFSIADLSGSSRRRLKYPLQYPPHPQLMWNISFSSYPSQLNACPPFMALTPAYMIGLFSFSSFLIMFSHSCCVCMSRFSIRAHLS